ncbi:MAG: hypothetical protein JO006_17270 [Paucibacter sp.]|nr:hypothetical protein [Roseateles sp.]
MRARARCSHDRTSPYEVYDIGAEGGGVGVETDHDTAPIAEQKIRCWLYTIGWPRRHNARELLINANGSGGNGHRVRLWKLELSHLAQEACLNIPVYHFQPGRSNTPCTAPPPVRWLLLLFFIVMPLDGEEHARAEHENLERNEDYREPIHHFEYFQAIT